MHALHILAYRLPMNRATLPLPRRNTTPAHKSALRALAVPQNEMTLSVRESGATR